MMNDNPPIFPVDAILLAVKTGTRAETEAVAELGDLAKHQLLDWNYLRLKDETLYRKVEEWCRMHPPEL